MQKLKRVFHLLLFGLLISHAPQIMRAFIRTQTIHHDNGSFIKDFSIIRLADGEAPKQPSQHDKALIMSKSSAYTDVSFEYFTV